MEEQSRDVTFTHCWNVTTDVHRPFCKSRSVKCIKKEDVFIVPVPRIKSMTLKATSQNVSLSSESFALLIYERFTLCLGMWQLCFMSTQSSLSPSLSRSGYWVLSQMNNWVDHNNSLPPSHPNLWPLRHPWDHKWQSSPVTLRDCITYHSAVLHVCMWVLCVRVCLNNLKESKVPILNYYMKENHVKGSSECTAE